MPLFPPPAAAGGGGGFAAASLVIGDADFGAASGITTNVEMDTQVSSVGSALTWDIGDPTKLHVVTAGVYSIMANWTMVDSYLAVGNRSIVISVPGYSSLPPATLYPAVAESLSFGHIFVGPIAAASDVTFSVSQSSGLAMAGDLFVVTAVRIG